MAIVNRWYQILNLLVLHDTLSIDQMKEIVHVSDQTLKKDIRLLNEQIQGYAHINEVNKSYQLVIDKYDSFFDIMEGSLKGESDFNSSNKRAAYILKRLIESDTYVLIDDLSDEVGVSRSTVNKDLKEVKRISNAYSVDVVGTPNKGLILEGNELELRLIYLNHVIDYFPEKQLPQAVTDLIEAYCEEQLLEKTICAKWKKVVCITLNRILSGRPMTREIQHYTNYQLETEAFLSFICELETEQRLSLGQYDIDFISFPLNISNTGTVEKQYINESFVRTLFDVMMVKVREVALLEIDEEKLYQNLYFHLSYLLNRLIFHFETYDYFYGEIEKNYPFAYELAKVAMRELCRKIERQPTAVETSYLAVYFELSLREQESKQEKEIAIVCNTGKGTAALIHQQIQTVLGPDIRIVQYTESEYEKQDMDRYFAIFTTIPLKNIKEGTPVIRLTNLFNDEWLQMEWQRVRKSRQLDFSSVIFRVAHLTPEKSYELHLTSMISELEEAQLVDENFGKRIFYRETQQTTVFSNGVAFPHALNEAHQEIVFFLGILPDTLQTPDGDIQLIFLVGIPNQMSDGVEAELLNLYNSMLKIASDNRLRHMLKRIGTGRELMDWMKEEVL